MVFALSPQAKGRVERTAGTLQDRLVAELRLAGATTIEEANVVPEAISLSASTLASESWRNKLPFHALEADVCRKSSDQVAQPQGGQGQHGEVPLAHLAATARLADTTQLRRNGGRGLGRLGCSAGCAIPGRDHPQPGGAAPSWHTSEASTARLTRVSPSTRESTVIPWQHSTPGSTPPMLASAVFEENGATRVRKVVATPT